jgi:hypothetical protein
MDDTIKENNIDHTKKLEVLVTAVATVSEVIEASTLIPDVEKSKFRANLIRPIAIMLEGCIGMYEETALDEFKVGVDRFVAAITINGVAGFNTFVQRVQDEAKKLYTPVDDNDKDFMANSYPRFYCDEAIASKSRLNVPLVIMDCFTPDWAMNL